MQGGAGRDGVLPRSHRLTTPCDRTSASQPPQDERVNRSMRIQTVQIVTGLLAAVAFVIAFISSGVAIISLAFAVLGAVALAWLVYTVAKTVLTHRGERDATPTA